MTVHLPPAAPWRRAVRAVCAVGHRGLVGLALAYGMDARAAEILMPLIYGPVLDTVDEMSYPSAPVRRAA